MFLKKMNLYVIFSILSIIIIYAGFSINLYKSTNYYKYYDKYYSFMKNKKLFPEFPYEDTFSTFDRWSESLIMGRLVKSSKDGLLSSGGFIGHFPDNIPDPPDGVSSVRFKQAYQYEIYLEKDYYNKYNNYSSYNSQLGGQGIFLGILNKIIQNKNVHKLKFFYFLMAAISTIVIFSIILWFTKEFGLITGLVLVISFSLFCYPTLYAKNLYWALWSFYIPFLIFIWILRKEDLYQKNLSYMKFFFLGLIGIIIKIFFNGFEFITTTVFMTLIPLYYYGIKNKWDIKLLLNRTIFSSLGILVAILISFVLLSIQFVVAGQSFEDGLKHIQKSFLKRTQLVGARTPGEMRILARSDTSVRGVLQYYTSRPVVVDLTRLGVKTIIRQKHILILFTLISIFIIFMYKFRRNTIMPKKIKALIITHWLSIIPPLSWFILFRQHSIIHKVHTPIVWYMPYMFYGVAISGVFLKEMFHSRD